MIFSPYTACVKLKNDRPEMARRACPYDWGGYCKRIVAVFLKYVRDSDDVGVATPLEERLDALIRDELSKLALTLIERNPDTLHLVEGIPRPTILVS